MMPTEDRTQTILDYMFKYRNRGFIADNDLIHEHIAFQYQIDFSKPKIGIEMRINRYIISDLIKDGLTFDDAMDQLYIDSKVIAKRSRNPKGWFMILTNDEMREMENRYKITNETRVENCYEHIDALKYELEKIFLRNK